VLFGTAFAGTPVAYADPYDGDDGGSSYDDGGGDTGGGFEEPSSGGIEEPSGGGAEDPSGGMEEPSVGTHDEPGGADELPGGTPDEPGGIHDEPGGDAEAPGGTNEVPGDGPGSNDANGGDVAEPTPQGPQVSDPDVKTASSSEVTTTTTTEMTSEEYTSFQSSISSTVSSSSFTTGLSLSSPVALWNSSWISYDRYYRPVFTNPYRTPLSIVYTSGGEPQTFVVPPLQRAAVNVPNTGVYSFTAATRPESGSPANLSVGSFTGGGFEPAPGQAPPQKPAPLNTRKNVLVQVRFDRGASAPFRVKTLTDLGADPTVNGATKVLLDEEIPAWGQWSKTDKGDALFVINQTQTLPGVNPPGQEPLPGYNVKLTAAVEKQSWIDRNMTVLVGVAIGAGVLALAAVGLILATRRRSSG
jgi:hypothetical protein